MPVETRASAISRTVLSSTFSANLFQLFHPMGGVGARSAAKQIGARESATTMNRCIAIECISSAMGAHCAIFPTHDGSKENKSRYNVNAVMTDMRAEVAPDVR